MGQWMGAMLAGLCVSLVSLAASMSVMYEDQRGTDRKDSGYSSKPQRQRVANRRRDPRAEPGGNLTDPQ